MDSPGYNTVNEANFGHISFGKAKFKYTLRYFFTEIFRINPVKKLFIAGASSVAEPPLFWAAPDGQGPGANSGSGSNLLGSAPALGKKRGLQVALAPFTKNFHFKLSKSFY